MDSNYYWEAAGPSTSSFTWEEEENTANMKKPCNERGGEMLSRQLKTFYLKKKMTDVVLKAEDAEFPAHKAILGAWSPILRTQFQDDVAKNKDVDIRGSSKEACEVFLNFMYTGKVEGEMSILKLSGLYTLANKFDVAYLKKFCMEAMLQKISVKTFCQFTSIALLHKEHALLETCSTFFVNNAIPISKSRQFLPFFKEHPEAVINLYIKALGESHPN